MEKDLRKSPEDLGLKTVLGDLVPMLEEGSALRREVEDLHKIVYTAPARQVADAARDLANRTKGTPGTGQLPYILGDKAEDVKI